DGARQARYARQ
ncbi:hypothetical protein D043_1363B, partial [Vibrio parahaemolyticus EKP-021]